MSQAFGQNKIQESSKKLIKTSSNSSAPASASGEEAKVPTSPKPYTEIDTHENLVNSLNFLLDNISTNGQTVDKKQEDEVKKTLNYVGLLTFQYFKTKKEMQEKKSKRVEEKQKMFFKKAFKFVENSFFQQKYKKKKIQKRFKNYSDFYFYYFSEPSKKYNIDLINYHHPQKSTIKNKQTGQRSFNQVYIDLILGSEKFRKDVRSYLNQNFYNETMEERDNKIFKFIQKCYKIIEDALVKEAKIDKFQYDSFINDQHLGKLIKQEELEKYRRICKNKLEDYIVKNPKCKIPWSQAELEETKAFALQYIDNFEQQQMIGTFQQNVHLFTNNTGVNIKIENELFKVPRQKNRKQNQKSYIIINSQQDQQNPNSNINTNTNPSPVINNSIPIPISNTNNNYEQEQKQSVKQENSQNQQQMKIENIRINDYLSHRNQDISHSKGVSAKIEEAETLSQPIIIINNIPPQHQSQSQNSQIQSQQYSNYQNSNHQQQQNHQNIQQNPHHHHNQHHHHQQQQHHQHQSHHQQQHNQDFNDYDLDSGDNNDNNDWKYDESQGYKNQNVLTYEMEIQEEQNENVYNNTITNNHNHENIEGANQYNLIGQKDEIQHDEESKHEDNILKSLKTGYISFNSVKGGHSLEHQNFFQSYFRPNTNHTEFQNFNNSNSFIFTNQYFNPTNNNTQGQQQFGNINL